MPISFLSLNALTNLLLKPDGKTQILDVRESVEFEEEHLKGSRSIPLSRLETLHEKLDPEANYILICQSGSRARKAAHLLESLGFNYLNVSEAGIEVLREKHENQLVYAAKRKLWTIDRQFRMALGLLIAIGLLGKLLLTDWFLIIPGIICVGLIFTSLIDRCYFRALIAAMPWNKGVPSH